MRKVPALDCSLLMSAPIPSPSKLLMTQSISSLGPTTNPSRDKNMETTTLLMGNRILRQQDFHPPSPAYFFVFGCKNSRITMVARLGFFGNKKHVVSVLRFILLEIGELSYGVANDSLRFLGGPARIRTGDRQVSLLPWL